MISFLNLIRYKNLLGIAATQYLVKYALLIPFAESHGVVTTLNPFHFFLLVLATVCIVAGGYVINAVYSIESDAVNNPEKAIITKTITEKDGFTMFMVLTVIGVGLGFYLANYVDKSNFFVFFFICSALLYIYASALKQMVIIGNVIVSIVAASVILVVGIFELFPVINSENMGVQLLFFNIIRDYAIFIFLIYFLKNSVNAIKNTDGDYKAGMQTLPIVLGKKRATMVAFFIAVLILFILVYYIIVYLFTQQLVIAYVLLGVIAPLIFTSIKLFNAKKKSHYNFINSLLNSVLIAGLLSMALYKFVILNTL
ncbi:MAG: geranylgeranylglycerol-phosphate geranylgeranyltransferase [Winogradskyella sp.]